MKTNGIPSRILAWTQTHRRHNLKKALALLGVFVLATAAGHAATIVSWDMSGEPGTQVTQTGVLDSATGGVLSRVTVTPSASNDSFTSINWNTTNTRNDNTNYITFSLQPTVGHSITFTDLQFAINGTSFAPNQGVWGYSIDGGSFQLGNGGDGGAFTLTTAAPSSLSTWNFNPFTVSSSDTVDFRFWAFGATAILATNASTTGGAVRIANIAGNDLIVNGTIETVPEPATFGPFVVMGLLGIWAFGYRRPRKLS